VELIFLTQFTGEASFFGAQFTGRVYFLNAQFTGIVAFQYAQFTGGANFWEAQFTGEASFFNTQFTEGVIFSRARVKQANFYYTRFAGNADFSEVQSTEKAHPHLDFQNVQFDDQEHTIFLKINLSEVSLVNTDITRVRFGEDVVWGDNFKIREEREIENQLKTNNIARDVQLGDVLAVYRNLRENYEFRLRYDEAGENHPAHPKIFYSRYDGPTNCYDQEN
jgi:uncharacterized protein YjbI with pentapeptide repeats